MMHRLVIAFVVVVLLFWITGCSDSPTDAGKFSTNSEISFSDEEYIAQPLSSNDPQMCETKEKCLPIAGCVTITTAFCDVSVGATVLVEIVSANGTLALDSTVSIKHVTPRPGHQTATAEISHDRLSDKQVSVTLNSCSAWAKTVHLNVYVDTGEKIGINLQMVRHPGSPGVTLY